ncbi:hypothetical protein D3C87_339670 [compost metagenome]
MTHLLKNSRGQSLVQVLITIGIMAILASVMATMNYNQAKQNKALTQKLETLDLKNLIQNTFTVTGNCTCQLSAEINTANAPNLSFNSSAPAESQSLSLLQLKSGCSPSANVLAKDGELVPGTQTQLRVQRISLDNIKPTGNPNEFLGMISVHFDPNSTAHALAPLRINQKFITTATSPNTAKVIQTCENENTVAPVDDVYFSTFYTSPFRSPPDSGDVALVSSADYKFCALMASAADENGSWCRTYQAGGYWRLTFGKTDKKATYQCQAICLKRGP